jgi:ComF family protein
VHRFKFRDIGSLAEVMATPMTGLVDWQVEAVVPVPLSGRRQRERGYNQSRLLAKHVAAGLDVPLVDALRHTRFSPPQAGGLTREQRFANVANAFAVSAPGMVRGRSLLLVDDVATTGATLDACATTLVAAGARVVTAVTFARD